MGTKDSKIITIDWKNIPVLPVIGVVWLLYLVLQDKAPLELLFCLILLSAGRVVTLNLRKLFNWK